MRYAIKHIPTGNFLQEYEGGSFLLEESEGFFTWGRKEDAEKTLSYYDDDEEILTEYGNFPVNEFEVAEI